MGIMLPTATDNGGRLAAILPTGLAALARGLGEEPREALGAAGFARSLAVAGELPAELLPPIRSLVVVAVDGLGSANLKARAGHAPTLGGLPQRRITTVTPSTTAAALTTLLTGALPAEHGLLGYRIMHPELGLLAPLRDWDGIADARSWQLAEPLFAIAGRLGARAVAYGRPTHAASGFTRVTLSGAEFVGGERIADRFSSAAQQLATGEPTFAYVYVDELDRAGHHDGWQSEAWSRRLEQLDAALDDFLRRIPPHTGVVLTADHGMVDVAPHQQIMLDLDAAEFAEVRAIGGEPRFRTFHLREGADPHSFTARLDEQEGRRAWVATREEAVAAGLFGPSPSRQVVDRLGEVILAARGQLAYYSELDDPASLRMVGQHGSWTDEERGVPLILAGALAGSGFAKAVETVAGATVR